MKNSYFNVASIFILSSLSLIAMEQPLNVTDIKQPQTIDDIPEYCVNLIKKLDAQPWDNSSKKPCKFLSFNNEFGPDDSRICDILCDNEKIQYPANFWHIRIEPDKQVDKGIIHIHYPDEITSPSFAQLQTRYYSFIQKLQYGWYFEKATNYPDIYHIQPETTHHLLIKKGVSLYDEDTLIQFLASKFNMSNLLTCNDTYLKSSPNGGPIYLWVKKAAWQQFQAVFKLEVKENK